MVLERRHFLQMRRAAVTIQVLCGLMGWGIGVAHAWPLNAFSALLSGLLEILPCQAGSGEDTGGRVPPGHMERLQAAGSLPTPETNHHPPAEPLPGTPAAQEVNRIGSYSLECSRSQKVLSPKSFLRYGQNCQNIILDTKRLGKGWQESSHLGT